MIKNNLWIDNLKAFLFISIFFMPYVLGNLRIEIILIAILIPFSLFKLQNIKRDYYSFFIYSILLVVLSTTFIFFREFNSFLAAMGWLVNINFIFLSFLIFYLYRTWLVNNLDKLLFSLFILSLPINLIAIFQYIDPFNELHHIIFNLYGGTPSSQFKALGMNSFAEGLVILAHRSTGIFNGVHVLGMFNILVVGLAIFSLQEKKINKLLLYIAVILAILGGMSAVSKTFIFGLIIMILIFIQYKLLNIKTLFLFLSFILMIFIFMYILVLDGNINIDTLIKQTEVDNVLTSRFSGKGYLTESVNYLLSNPSAFILGEGISSKNIHLADSQIIVLFGMGGIVLFASFIIVLLIIYLLIKKYISSSYNKVTMGIFISYIAIGIGIPSFNVGRIISLFFIFLFIGIEKSRIEKSKIEIGRIN